MLDQSAQFIGLAIAIAGSLIVWNKWGTWWLVHHKAVAIVFGAIAVTIAVAMAYGWIT